MERKEEHAASLRGNVRYRARHFEGGARSAHRGVRGRLLRHFSDGPATRTPVSLYGARRGDQGLGPQIGLTRQPEVWLTRRQMGAKLAHGAPGAPRTHVGEARRLEQNPMRLTLFAVMAGLVPAIHVFEFGRSLRRGCPRQARA